jgi:aspartate ammonia-lyase
MTAGEVTTMAESRVERDALGEMPVPADAYWGIATARALENYPISGLMHHPTFIDAFIMVKSAAALANRELGLLEERIANAIVQAGAEILRGALRDQFVVDVYQMGAGTSIHMNVNEVLANRAIEILGGQRGDYALVNPNDHVNMGQSTNDAFPTAMRLAARMLLSGLWVAVGDLADAFAAKGEEFDGIVKSARTHLQDAVPIRLGQEFAAYAEAMRKCRLRLDEAALSLEELGIGGSAAGTGLNTHPEYRERVIAYLREWTDLDLRPAADLREAMQSNQPIAHASSALKLLALELIRIANDLRLLASGPMTGLAEITLPAVQPGSSIMPGKVNPSMAEMLNMVCFQVVGNDLAISMAVQAGQLELNVMMPLMNHNLLQSIEILTNAIAAFTERCVSGIVADEERCRYYVERTMGLATALNTYIGYANAAAVAKEALQTGRSIVDLVREKGLLPEDQIAAILDPRKMTEPGIPGKE